MTDQQPDAQGQDREPTAGGTARPDQAAARRPGYWLPLLAFGGLTAFSLPFSVLTTPHSQQTGLYAVQGGFPTVTRALYLGWNPFGSSPFPLGWYWTGMLMTGFLITAAWYRWRNGRAGRQTPLAVYLVSGLALAAVNAALPLAAWGSPLFPVNGSSPQSWIWLDALWQLGMFALLSVAVTLGVLARAERSRTLAVITVIYACAVCYRYWLDVSALPLPSLFFPAPEDPSVMLPAAILLAGGAGALLGAGLRARRSRPAQPSGSAG